MHRAQAPIRTPADYNWVDPDNHVVVNGKVMSVTKVYRDLWGGSGIEHSEMATVLDLYSTSPSYRKTSLSGWNYGGIPKEWANTLTTVSCLRWGWLPDTCQAQEKEKVWLYSRQFREVAVLTWDDTYANGKRIGNGFYKRDAKRIIRFDEVVPLYGGSITTHENGLIEISLPPRNHRATDAQGCVVNGMLNDVGDCNVRSAFLPSAFGTYGEDKVFAIIGWQADSSNTAVADVIRQTMNLTALKIEGRTPTSQDRFQEFLDAGTFWIPFIVLVIEANVFAASVIEYYFPTWAGSVPTVTATPLTAEYADEMLEREAAFVNGVQMSEAEVANLAREQYGIDQVIGEFQTVSQRGWYWKTRSMTPSAAKAQMMQDGEVLEIVPGKYICKEFFTGGGNGVWMDGYDKVLRILRENKGFYAFMVKNGAIDPAFIKNEKFLRIVDQLERQAVAAQGAGDRLQWMFSEPEFPKAFENWLSLNRPGLYRLMGSGPDKVFSFAVY